MKNILHGVLLLVLIPAKHFALTHTIDVPSANKPRFALTITIPAVVRPKSEILVEINYMNISDQTLLMSPGLQESEIFGVNVRGSNGKPIPRLLKEHANGDLIIDTRTSVSLLPGKSITNNLMLDRIVDLTGPGEYTVDVSLYDAPQTKVTSNSVRFCVPQKALSSARATASISISISSPERSVPPGWQVPILISLKNLTRQSLNLAAWEGNLNGTIAEPDEFGSGIEVFDVTHSKKLQPNESGNQHQGDSYPRGHIVMLPVQSREELQQCRAVGSIYDLSKQGTYRIRVGLVDPVTGHVVESKPLTVAIVDSSSQPSTAVNRKRPPFMVSIRRYPEDEGRQFPILICMTNISDHDIRLDNAITKDILQAYDSAGRAAALMPDGLTLQQQFGSTGSTTHTVDSRGTLCGVITLDTLFDFSTSSRYSFRVDRYDEPDALPGQKLQDLQIVQSNTIGLTGPISSSQ